MGGLVLEALDVDPDSRSRPIATAAVLPRASMFSVPPFSTASGLLRELVALGVAAEIVVVVENQDPGAGPRPRGRSARRQGR